MAKALVRRLISKCGQFAACCSLGHRQRMGKGRLGKISPGRVASLLLPRHRGSAGGGLCRRRGRRRGTWCAPPQRHVFTYGCSSIFQGLLGGGLFARSLRRSCWSTRNLRGLAGLFLTAFLNILFEFLRKPAFFGRFAAGRGEALGCQRLLQRESPFPLVFPGC
jgi:hypothetical protein